MERPKIHEVTPVQREVTPEIVYLDMMRRAQQWPEPYETVSDMAIQLHEQDAALYREHGVRPAIMDEYEQYDSPTPPLEASCIAMADELLSHKEVGSPLTFVDVVVEVPPEEVRDRLQRLAAGRLLASNDEQLAMESDGSYYPVLDIRKADATLVGVGVQVWGWDDDKIARTDTEGEPYNHNKHVLVYPSTEKTHRRKIDIQFSYDHPESYFSETVSLQVSSEGGTQLSRAIWASAYAETGYEGQAGKSLRHGSKQAAAEFADLVAEIVGDDPLSVREFADRQFAEYLQQVTLPEAREYLQEWLENSWCRQVLHELGRVVVDTETPRGDIALYDALLAPEYAHQSFNVVKQYVDGKRAEHNNAVANNGEMFAITGILIEPWRDRVKRVTPPVRIAQYQSRLIR